MMGAGRKMGLYQGRIFWSGSVSLVDGKIEETHTLREAQEADFHHTFYFSPEQALKIDDGECGFFWITEDGEVEAEWRESLDRDIICSIKEQIAVVEWTESMENEAYVNEQERKREEMTGFEKFQQKIKNGILAYLPEEYRDAAVEIVHVPGNNDQEQTAMTIKREGQEMAARVFLDEYYARFPDWVSDETILQTVAGDYLENESKREWAENMRESAKDFDTIKENIRVEVVNRDMNKESLKNCPKKEIEGTDLLAVFRMQFYEQGKVCANALVTNELMETWDMDVETLYETALDNTAVQMPAQICSLMSVYFDGEESLEPGEVFSEEQGMYVLTNPQKSKGAAAMLYPGLLQSIAEATQSSFYILPSSIHEVLLMKEGNGMGAKELQSMVTDINQAQVPPQEVLSNQVYFYDGKEQKISMALSPEETRDLVGNREMATARYEGMETEGMEEEMER